MAATAAATAPVLESLERASEGLRRFGPQLVDSAPPEKRADVLKEYDDLADQLKRREEFLKEDSSNSLEQNDLSADIGKIESTLSSHTAQRKDLVPDELKKPIRDIRNDLELNDRLFVLSASAPEDETKAQAALRWFSQKEEARFLDFLFDITDHLKETYGQDTVELIVIAKQGILKKGFARLLEFYGFSEAEILRVIEETIARYGDIQPAVLKDLFKAGSPTQVLERLEEMRGILEDYVEDAETRRWLASPNNLFARQSPREALSHGNTFKVYQFLIGLAHGVHS